MSARGGVASVFGIGIGSAPNRYLLDGIAAGGHGLARDVSSREPRARVVDAVYQRPAGGLLERAAARGLRVQDGLPMLLWQGVRALERWLDLELSAAAVAAKRAALYAENLPDQPGPR